MSLLVLAELAPGSHRAHKEMESIKEKTEGISQTLKTAEGHIQGIYELTRAVLKSPRFLKILYGAKIRTFRCSGKFLRN